MVPASYSAFSLGKPGVAQRTALVTATCLSIGGLLLAQALKTTGHRSRSRVIVSPPKGTHALRADGSPLSDLPYPPDALPGRRDVDTPYGSVRFYEWGPETGERVLLVHGISTPSVALGDLAHELADRGYRVMLFDLFGRGYSDAPMGVDYDARLYVSQLLLVLVSSPVAWWTGGPAGGFHLVGYSLGGGLGVAFARYMPHLVRSLSLVAPCGLIRRDVHVGWRSRLLYDSFVARRLLPGALIRYLVRRRIRPPTPPPAASQAEPAEAETVNGDTAGTTPSPTGGAEKRRREAPGNSDASGGAAFDGGLVAPRHGQAPGATVSSVVRWQVDRHEGFVAAFLSTIRHAPIYAPQGDWAALSSLLAARRGEGNSGNDDSGVRGGLCGGRVHVVLGEDDPVIVRDETELDAREALGSEGVAFTVLPAGGHEIPMSRSAEVAEALVAFWNTRTQPQSQPT